MVVKNHLHSSSDVHKNCVGHTSGHTQGRGTHSQQAYQGQQSVRFLLYRICEEERVFASVISLLSLRISFFLNFKL